MKFYSSNHLHAFIWDYNALANKKNKIKINGNAHKENRVCNMPRYCHTRHRGLIRELQASTRVESASPGERSTVNTCSRLHCCGKMSPAEGEVFSHNKNTSPERFLHQTPREWWQPTTHFHHKFHKKWYTDSGGGSISAHVLLPSLLILLWDCVAAPLRMPQTVEEHSGWDNPPPQKKKKNCAACSWCN